jgi:hypothetical protein
LAVPLSSHDKTVRCGGCHQALTSITRRHGARHSYPSIGQLLWIEEPQDHRLYVATVTQVKMEFHPDEEEEQERANKDEEAHVTLDTNARRVLCGPESTNVDDPSKKKKKTKIHEDTNTIDPCEDDDSSVTRGTFKVHFSGWAKRFDTWLDVHPMRFDPTSEKDEDEKNRTVVKDTHNRNGHQRQERTRKKKLRNHDDANTQRKQHPRYRMIRDCIVCHGCQVWFHTKCFEPALQIPRGRPVHSVFLCRTCLDVARTTFAIAIEDEEKETAVAATAVAATEQVDSRTTRIDMEHQSRASVVGHDRQCMHDDSHPSRRCVNHVKPLFRSIVSTASVSIRFDSTHSVIFVTRSQHDIGIHSTVDGVPMGMRCTCVHRGQMPGMSVRTGGFFTRKRWMIEIFISGDN